MSQAAQGIPGHMFWDAFHMASWYMRAGCTAREQRVDISQPAMSSEGSFIPAEGVLRGGGLGETVSAVVHVDGVGGRKPQDAWKEK